MHIVSLDDFSWRVKLFPLTLTRPAGDLRVGILTIAEKWAKRFACEYSFLTQGYLSAKFPSVETSEDILAISGNICPDQQLFDAVAALRNGEALWSGVTLIALRSSATDFRAIDWGNLTAFKPIYYAGDIVSIRYCEDIFMNNGDQIALDYELLTAGRTSVSLPDSNHFLGDRIFAEAGATAEFSTFNSTQGPIYLAKNSEVWEGSHIRGAFSLGEHSAVKMGAKIYSNVSVGPHCRVGGELNTSVIWGNSSKGHEGYLGSAVIGEWCNWGADTNNSNLKNNYKPVKVYDYSEGGYRDTGLQFCGIVMADHSKCAINTAFNTGTVVGVGCSVFGHGMPPKYLPDFSWGGSEGLVEHGLEKMYETAALVYLRRNRNFDETEKQLLATVYALTKPHRKF